MEISAVKKFFAATQWWAWPSSRLAPPSPTLSPPSSLPRRARWHTWSVFGEGKSCWPGWHGCVFIDWVKSVRRDGGPASSLAPLYHHLWQGHGGIWCQYNKQCTSFNIFGQQKKSCNSCKNKYDSPITFSRKPNKKASHCTLGLGKVLSPWGDEYLFAA